MTDMFVEGMHTDTSEVETCLLITLYLFSANSSCDMDLVLFKIFLPGTINLVVVLNRIKQR